MMNVVAAEIKRMILAKLTKEQSVSPLCSIQTKKIVVTDDEENGHQTVITRTNMYKGMK